MDDVKLYRYRQVPIPTLPGGVLLVILLFLSVRLSLPAAHRFLALDRPVGSGGLVVEGWVSDEALPHVVALYHRGGYERIYAVGGPIRTGARLSEYGNLADMTAERLRAEGLPRDVITAVPAPSVTRDRTLASALALRTFLAESASTPEAIDIASVGTHARRTWRVFHGTMKNRARVGVVALPPEDYEPNAWWRSSAGFRAVVYEGLAYLYTRTSAPARNAPRAARLTEGDRHDQRP